MFNTGNVSAVTSNKGMCFKVFDMKVVIAGIRYKDADRPVKLIFDDFKAVSTAVARSGFEISQVISGGAIGVDQLGETWAALNNIPVTCMPVTPAEWQSLGKRAGPMRNRRMAEACDAAIIIWDGQSKGTKNMIAEMQRLSKPYYLYMVIPNIEEILYD